MMMSMNVILIIVLLYLYILDEIRTKNTNRLIIGNLNINSVWTCPVKTDIHVANTKGAEIVFLG